MKRRIIMVSAMILLLGSQAQMFANNYNRPEPKRPGMEMNDNRRPRGPVNDRRISDQDIERVQDFYRRKYNIKLSRKEAERILIEDMRNNGRPNRPAPPKGPQRPPRR